MSRVLPSGSWIGCLVFLVLLVVAFVIASLIWIVFPGSR